MNWSDLHTTIGTYISPEYDVSSAHQMYEENFRMYYEKNDGEVIVYVRTAFDGSTWGDWIQITDAYYDAIFKDDFYDMQDCKFQYRVDLVYHNSGISPKFISFTADMTGAFIVFNEGDVFCKPELWITKRGSSGDIRIYNQTNSQVLELLNLNKDEEVYVDCENEDIVSSLPTVYRYSDHNDIYLQLEVGENLILGEGVFDLTIRTEYKLLQG